MEVVNYSEFRKHLKENLDRACDNAEVIVVSRPQNKNVVVISLDEYNSWMETRHLLDSEANRKRLLKSIDSLAKGKILAKTPKDFEKKKPVGKTLPKKAS